MDKPSGEGSLVKRFRLICAATVDRNLTKADGAVLSVILQRMRKDSMRAWPSMDRISEDAEVDRRTVTRSIARLLERGYLSREAGRSHTANVYIPGRLSEEPIDADAPEFRDTHAPEFGGADDTTGLGLLTSVPPNSGAATPPNSGAALPPESVQSISEDLKQKEHGVFSGTESVTVDAGNAPRKPSRRAGRSATETSAGFDAFWAAYASKINRKGAWAIWLRDELEELADAIVAHVEASNERDTRWRAGYVPHPTTYLNQERWTTEPFIDRRRESAADRAERLGNEALRRLGEDERGSDALIAEMEQSGDTDETWYLRTVV